MADRNQLKKAVPSNQINDDPFAELTRIMGFDPRVPVSRGQPAAVEKLAAVAAEQNDFSIDLEKELMGEFADLDEDVEVRAQVAARPLPQPEMAKEENAPGEHEDTLTEDFDFVFDADLAAKEHDPGVIAAADKALADELEAAFATEPAFDESVAAEMPADTIAGEISVDEPATAVETEEPPADEIEPVFAAEPTEEPAAPVEAVKEEEPVGELETAFAEEPAAAEYETASDAAEAEEETLPDEVGEAFAAHFEDHIAVDAAGKPAAIEPEMSAEPELAQVEMQAFDKQPAEPVMETYDDAEEAPLIPLGAAREFARTSESLNADFDAASVEATQTFDEPSAEVGETEDDYDLEAELSALLGKGNAASTSGKAAVTPIAESELSDEPLPTAAVGEGVASFDDEWAIDRDDPLPLAAEAAEHEPIVYQEPNESHTELQHEEPVMAAESHHDVAHQHDYGQPELDAPAYQSVTEASHQDEAAYPEEDDPLSEFVVEQELQAELASLERDIDFSVDDLALTDEQPAYAAGSEDRYSAANEPVSADEPVVEATPENMTGSAEMTGGLVDEQPAPVHSSAHAPVHKAHEPLPVEEEEDPFAMLAAMVRQTPIAPSAPFTAPTGVNYQDLPRGDAPPVNESPAVSTNAYQYQYQSRPYTSRAPVDAPDIETVDVPESAVALADDLDIPDVAFEDDVPLAADFDDFEAELAAAFNQQTSTPAQSTAEPTYTAPRDSYQHEYAQYQQPAATTPSYIGGAAAATVAAAPAYAATQPAAHAGLDDGVADLDRGVFAGDQARRDYHAMDDDDLAYDPEMDEDMAIPAAYHDAAERHASGSRRGLWIAAIVGGVVLVGGIGAYALSGGNGVDAPALVRADTDPVKVRPENPGGTTVPNQDNKVFQTMNGTDTAAAPTQEKLISGTEEPVDVAARAEPQAITPQSAEEGEEAIEDAPLMGDDPIAAEIAAAPKGEDRVAPDAEEPAANNETLAVVPRRVRTMVVRSDGTLVPSEEPAAVAAQPQADDATAASALEPADPAKSLSDPIAPESTGSLKPSDDAPAEMADPGPDQTAAVTATAQPAAAPEPPAPATRSGMPESGPVAPSRPADQPVDVVGEVKPQKVAAASSAAAAGGWSMQIASQPSEAAAKSSYEDLARRYGSVIGGRGVNIVKADIAGKGTFWRVRVPAGSRNDAIALCESYKAAGGNCFVSK